MIRPVQCDDAGRAGRPCVDLVRVLAIDQGVVNDPENQHRFVQRSKSLLHIVPMQVFQELRFDFIMPPRDFDAGRYALFQHREGVTEMVQNMVGLAR